MLRFALAGNPNCGKTTLFNSVTGSTAHVGNWPGVTVDKREGVYKQLAEPISVVDLPGIYSLSPYTPEEVIARNFILDEKPDCVIDVVDATNLERNLYLTTQIMEIDVPVVIALNMIDAVEKRGDYIDAKELEKRLEVPVVKVSALKNTNLDKLMERAYESAKKKRKGKSVLMESQLNHLISDLTIALSGQGVENPVFHAVKLAELDDLEICMHKDTVSMVEAFKKSNASDTFGEDYEALIADARYKYITKYFSPALKRKDDVKFGLTQSDKADRILTHRIWGLPVFLIILFAIFHLTFSENFLFLGGILGKDFVSLEGTAFEGVFGSGGINSPGVVLQGLVETGTSALMELVKMLIGNPDSWVSGLICDGVLSGIFAIFGFLPQILLLFLLFSILEDSGYMARIAFILDRLLRKFGLSGRAFLPMIMGFGCSVPAIINTRTLADEKEKMATIRVIPFFSCGAKLPILTAVAGGIISYYNVGNVDLITYGMYLLGVVTALISVLIMRNTGLKGNAPPFIMELPAYHAPQFYNLMLLVWDKAKHFIKKAFTIILASTIVIWVIMHFSFDWRFLSDEQVGDSILANIGKMTQPIFTPLGFGSQLNSLGWVFIVASISGIIAKENVISTLGTFAGCLGATLIDIETDGGVGAVTAMISATGITMPALLSFIAFNMTTIPCTAACAAAKGEMPDRKSFRNTLFFWLITSFIVSSAVYTIGTYPLSALAWITVFVVTIFIIKRNSKKKVNV